MNWEAVGAIGGITGAFAVFVTLVYLAIQLKENNRNLRGIHSTILSGSETTLPATGRLRGGSSLGNGVSVAKDGIERECSVTGYIRLEVADLAEAKLLLEGNPLYEAGGFVELLEEIPDKPDGQNTTHRETQNTADRMASSGCAGCQ